MHLLDTHTLLWWLSDPGHLSHEASEILRLSRAVYVSAVSTWARAIKRASGKLTAPDGLADQIAKSHFQPLPITIPHSLAIAKLPPHHSHKPEQVRELVERVSPGPYLELFGRRAVHGWVVFGDEVE